MNVFGSITKSPTFRVTAQHVAGGDLREIAGGVNLPVAVSVATGALADGCCEVTITNQLNPPEQGDN